MSLQKLHRKNTQRTVSNSTHTHKTHNFLRTSNPFITIGIVDENLNTTRIKGYLLLALPPKDKSNGERKHPSRPGRDSTRLREVRRLPSRLLGAQLSPSPRTAPDQPAPAYLTGSCRRLNQLQQLAIRLNIPGRSSLRLPSEPGAGVGP